MNGSLVRVAAICALALSWLPAVLFAQGYFGYAPDENTLVFGGSSYARVSKVQEDSRALYKQPLGAGPRSLLRRFEGVVTELKAAPAGGKVAALERFWEEDVGPDRGNFIDGHVVNGQLVRTYYFEASILQVLDLSGRLLASLPDVRRFAWSPDGTKLAYITGKHHEGGRGFIPNGTWVHDLPTQASRQIDAGSIDVQWAHWDGGLYVDRGYTPESPGVRVDRFDPATGALSRTARKGIHFSPDGAYYYRPGEEGDLLVLYLARDDSVVEVELTSSMDRKRPAYEAAGWLDASTLITHSSTSEHRGVFLHNVKTGERRYFQGMVLGVGGRSDQAILIEGTTARAADPRALALR